MKISFLIILLSTLSFSQIFVSNQGVDGEGYGGSFDSPFLTIKYGLSKMLPEDTLYVAPGIYYEDELLIRNNNISILGSVSNSNAGFSIIYVKNAKGKFFNISDVENVHIEGFVIDLIFNDNDQTKAIYLNNSNFCHIKNNVIINSVNEVISLDKSSNNTIDHNIIGPIPHHFNNKPSNSISVEGILIDGLFRPSNDNKILFNTIYTNRSHYPINLNLTTNETVFDPTKLCSGNEVAYNKIDSGWCGIYVVQQKNFSIHNNLILNSTGYNDLGEITELNEGHGINLDYKYTSIRNNVDSEGSKIYNNTIVNSYNVGIWNKNITNIFIENNLLYNNGLRGTNKSNGDAAIRIFSNDSTIIINNNLYNSIDTMDMRCTIGDFFTSTDYLTNLWINGDSTFGAKDPYGYTLNPNLKEDFSIDEYSPAFRTGLDLGAGFSIYSFNEITRSNNWDIGAFAYNDFNSIRLELTKIHVVDLNTIVLEFNKNLDVLNLVKFKYFVQYNEVISAKLISSTKIELQLKDRLSKSFMVVVDSIKDENGSNILPQFRSIIVEQNVLTSYMETDEPKYDFNLMQNHPNPFNPYTKINYTISSEGLALIKIINILGEEILTLVEEFKTPGLYSIEFNASELPSGIYFYSLEFNKSRIIKKMVLMK